MPYSISTIYSNLKAILRAGNYCSVEYHPKRKKLKGYQKCKKRK